MIYHPKLRRPFRKGVTIIEVLFATGIAVFGLVGIASLIAVGGRQASDANKSTESQAAALVAYSDFFVRGYNEDSRWVWYNDQLPLAFRDTPFGSIAAPLSRGTTVPGMRTPNRHAVCIDPTFFSDPLTAAGLQNPQYPFNDSQRFRPGLFPYFQDNYNPLAPSSPLSSNLGRLLRVGIGTRGGGMLAAKASDRVFQFADDLAISMDEEDRTLPSERLFSFITTPQNAVIAQSLGKSEYSWFATLCPREPTPVELQLGLVGFDAPEKNYTLSIVVCKRRDRSFDPSTEVPRGERVVAVDSTINFKGGSGGRVIFSAARNELSPLNDVSDSMLVGAWVMLCKQQSLGGAALGTICRWYRIVATDNESDESSPNIWSRNVILDGPDWVFDSQPTQATLVSGVVSVIERVVRVD